MTRKTELTETEVRLLRMIADIRAAVGDHEGKLMQSQLVEHCRALSEEVETLRRLVMNASNSLVKVARGPKGCPIPERSNKELNQIRAEAARFFGEVLKRKFEKGRATSKTRYRNED